MTRCIDLILVVEIGISSVVVNSRENLTLFYDGRVAGQHAHIRMHKYDLDPLELSSPSSNGKIPTLDKLKETEREQLEMILYYECSHLPSLPANHTRPFGRMIVVRVGHARAHCSATVASSSSS